MPVLVTNHQASRLVQTVAQIAVKIQVENDQFLMKNRVSFDTRTLITHILTPVHFVCQATVSFLLFKSIKINKNGTNKKSIAFSFLVVQKKITEHFLRKSRTKRGHSEQKIGK